MSFQERKKERKEYYEKHIKGCKFRTCIICSGSGYYDLLDKYGSPIKCACCNGTGKERFRPYKEKL